MRVECSLVYNNIKSNQYINNHMHVICELRNKWTKIKNQTNNNLIGKKRMFKNSNKSEYELMKKKQEFISTDQNYTEIRYMTRKICNAKKMSLWHYSRKELVDYKSTKNICLVCCVNAR